MSGFAEIEIEDEHIVKVDVVEETSEQRVEKAAGILRRERVSGFDADEAHPDGGRPPGAQEIGAGGRVHFKSGAVPS
jgi:hypothetical protein